MNTLVNLSHVESVQVKKNPILLPCFFGYLRRIGITNAGNNLLLLNNSKVHDDMIIGCFGVRLNSVLHYYQTTLLYFVLLLLIIYRYFVIIVKLKLQNDISS